MLGTLILNIRKVNVIFVSIDINCLDFAGLSCNFEKIVNKDRFLFPTICFVNKSFTYFRERTKFLIEEKASCALYERNCYSQVRCKKNSKFLRYDFRILYFCKSVLYKISTKTMQLCENYLYDSVHLCPKNLLYSSNYYSFRIYLLSS